MGVPNTCPMIKMNEPPEGSGGSILLDSLGSALASANS